MIYLSMQVYLCSFVFRFRYPYNHLPPNLDIVFWFLHVVGLTGVTLYFYISYAWRGGRYHLFYVVFRVLLFLYNQERILGGGGNVIKGFGFRSQVKCLQVSKQVLLRCLEGCVCVFLRLG